jgi:aryl-alcohol dehydrogenase-like predicted oxidoreductase
MKFNEFGKTGMSVSEIGFGGSRIGGFFAAKDSKAEALNVLRQALESGITFYDTANIYSQGESESLMGAAFRGRRDQVILATKGGFCLPAGRNLMKRIKPLLRPMVHALGLKRVNLPSRLAGTLSQDFSRPHLTKSLESSLKRLQTDYVDLYQLHSPRAPFLQTNAFGEALETLERLKVQGKVRFYGIATETPEDAPFCLSAPGISSVQIGFGPLDLEALDQGMLATAAQRGLGIIVRGCFGGGLLKDGLDAAQLQALTPKWQRILALRSLSKEMGRSTLDTAFQFCRGTPAVSVTLLGMRLENQLRENLRYVQAPPLNGAEYLSLRHSQEAEEKLTESE